MALISEGHIGTVVFTLTNTPGSGDLDDRNPPNPAQLSRWQLHGRRKFAEVTPFNVTQEVWVPSHVTYFWMFQGFIEKTGGNKPVEFHRNHIEFVFTPDPDVPANFFEGDGFVEEFKLRGQIGDLQRFDAFVRGSPNGNPLNIAGW